MRSHPAGVAPAIPIWRLTSNGPAIGRAGQIGTVIDGMTSAGQGDTDMRRAISVSLGAHWRLFLFEGAVIIILGILAVAVPAVATIAVDRHWTSRTRPLLKGLLP
jgi:hypothetical protein